ncbi:MAG TPA: hypothetical protein VGK67_18215 [Myxococcales bacterium]|jgi:hypothetical protein
MRRHLKRLTESGERGGAAVEFALVTMLCVPMAMYSIYAGEAFVASIKAQEAEISAGWETTAFLLHDYEGGGSGPLAQVAEDAAKRVKADLQDFDSFAKGAQVGLHGVFGHDTFDELECETRGLKGFAAPLAGNFLHADGWVGCKAKVTFENRRAPTDAHKEFFHGQPKIIADTIKELKMCGSGDTLKGCTPDGTRGFVVFTDDWGLEDPAAEKVGDYGGGNKKYWTVGDTMYQATGTGGAQGMLTGGLKIIATGFGDKGDTPKFKMGYLDTICTTRSFPSHGGSMTAHLSICHEVASTANGNTADLSQKTYSTRDQKNYMAMPDPNWNEQ